MESGGESGRETHSLHTTLVTLGTGDSCPHLQVTAGEGLLVDVGGVGAGRHSSHGGQVATEATHGLNDEHTALGARGRLLDQVTRLQWGWIWGQEKGFRVRELSACCRLCDDTTRLK